MTRTNRTAAHTIAVIALLLLLPAAWAATARAAPPVRNGGGGSDPTPTPPAVAREATELDPAATDQAVDPEQPAPPNAHIRPRPVQQPFDNPARGEVGTIGARVAVTADDRGGRRRVRLDDPVLRWLPEILAASEATGTPPSLIASVMEVESSGNPRAISPAGARGLMQIMPDELRVRSVPRSRWHHPATNILVGATILAERRESTGSWRGAVSRYFGIGCDAHGTCTNVYVRRVFAKVDRYARLIRDPEGSGLAVLPSDWRPPD
jgi:soluble lytic murein transglycosylase-like protein